MAGNICAPQYANKSCECLDQVVAGVTPATSQAANPLKVCAYREFGIQFPCDPGCCKTDCSNTAATSSTTSNVTSEGGLSVIPWWIIVDFIFFAFVLVSSFVYSTTQKTSSQQNKIIGIAVISALVILVVTLVGTLPKK